jgi:hypothetical protein
MESVPGAGAYDLGTGTPLMYFGCVSATASDIRRELFGRPGELFGRPGGDTAEKAATAGKKSNTDNIIIEKVQQRSSLFTLQKKNV